MRKEDKSYTYMIRCTDGSIYTGITKDVKRRMEEHKSRGKECAKYTRTHPFERLETVFEAQSWSEAARLEYAIKRLTKEQKEQLIASPEKVEEMFADKLSGCRFLPVVVK
nr:GIY-YIG nuclease family protein [Lachnospiraceae bacterium]